jgi:hypothetical protein
MMTALGVIQILLCVFSLATAAILVPILRYQRYRHFRREHREVFDQMGISSPSFLWREDRDAESTAFEQLFSSRKHESLRDPRLNALRRREKVIWRACGVSFAFLLATFLVFRSDANHVWDFLIDLAGK